MTNAVPSKATSPPAAIPPPTPITAKTRPVRSETAQVDRVFQVAHVVNSISVKSTHMRPVIPSETKQ